MATRSAFSKLRYSYNGDILDWWSNSRSRYDLGSNSAVAKPKTKTSTSTKHKLSFSEMITQDLEQKSKRRTPEEEARIQSQIDAEFRNADSYGSHSHLQLEPWKYKSKKILLYIIFAVYFTVIGFGFAIIIKL